MLCYRELSKNTNYDPFSKKCIYISVKAMNKSHFARIAVVSIGLVLFLSPALTEARSVNLPSPQCHPSIIQSMPPKIRKICDALSTIWEFSEAMENYLDEKGT